MTQGQLEFAISQYLDGTLPSEDVAALEQRLASDPAARELLDEYRSLDQIIRSDASLPAVQWNRLNEAIAGAVARQQQSLGAGNVAQPIADELEYSITQSIDGELPEDDQRALEARIESDQAAQQVTTQHRALNVIVKHAWPLPHVDWERLREHLCNAAGAAASPSRYSISLWIGRSAKLAVAACILLAIGIAVYKRVPSAGAAIVQVQGPQAEVAEGASVIQVQVGPSGDLAQSRFDRYAASGIVAAPSRVQLAQRLPQADEAGLPY